MKPVHSQRDSCTFPLNSFAGFLLFSQHSFIYNRFTINVSAAFISSHILSVVQLIPVSSLKLCSYLKPDYHQGLRWLSVWHLYFYTVTHSHSQSRFSTLLHLYLNHLCAQTCSKCCGDLIKGIVELKHFPF